MEENLTAAGLKKRAGRTSCHRFYHSCISGFIIHSLRRSRIACIARNKRTEITFTITTLQSKSLSDHSAERIFRSLALAYERCMAGDRCDLNRGDLNSPASIYVRIPFFFSFFFLASVRRVRIFLLVSRKKNRESHGTAIGVVASHAVATAGPTSRFVSQLSRIGCRGIRGVLQIRGDPNSSYTVRHSYASTSLAGSRRVAPGSSG